MWFDPSLSKEDPELQQILNRFFHFFFFCTSDNQKLLLDCFPYVITQVTLALTNSVVAQSQSSYTFGFTQKILLWFIHTLNPQRIVEWNKEYVNLAY